MRWRAGGRMQAHAWHGSSANGTHILFLQRALLAVVGIRDAKAATDDAAPGVRAVVALVADAHQGRRPHVTVAHDALAIACRRRG